MRLLFLSLFASLVLSPSFFSQKDNFPMAIHLLANDDISEINVDSDAFLEYMKQITDLCRNTFNKVKKKQKIGLFVSIHPSGATSFELYAYPKLDEQVSNKFISDLKAIKVVNTKLVDFPIFFAINGNKDGSLSDFPDFVTPENKKLLMFQNADLKGKYEQLKEFAVNEVLPVLAAYLLKAEDKYEGVRNLGKLISSTNFKENQDVEKLLNGNKDYWRAVLEMNVGNQLIPVTKVFSLVASGEIDYANKFIEILPMFSSEKSLASKYMQRLKIRTKLFYAEITNQIKIGIAEHDKGNFQKAISIYDNILSAYPNSAWALYEKYFSENEERISKDKEALIDGSHWDKAKIEIYKHNPLYDVDVRASNGKEAYLIFRRQEINKLFQKKEEALTDLFKYAEIAMDLNAYDYAAQLFWLSATHNKSSFEKSLHYFLYCLDKLGENEIKSNFKGDFKKIFKSIDEKRDDEMKQSFIYKAMKN